MELKEKLEARVAELRAIRARLLADYNKADGAVLAYEEMIANCEAQGEPEADD